VDSVRIWMVPGIRAPLSQNTIQRGTVALPSKSGLDRQLNRCLFWNLMPNRKVADSFYGNDKVANSNDIKFLRFHVSLQDVYFQLAWNES
jgi:hypothetical protein